MVEFLAFVNRLLPLTTIKSTRYYDKLSSPSFFLASIVDMLAKTRSKNTTLGVEINSSRTTVQNG